MRCEWRINSHAAIKVRSSSRIYIFRARFWLSTGAITVTLLILEDPISSRGLGMRKRVRLFFNAACTWRIDS